MGLEQLLGGLARGYGQGRMMKLERERQKEKDSLAKQLAQSQIASAKTKQEEYKLKQSLINSLLSGQAPQGANPNTTASASQPIKFDQSGEVDFGSSGVTTPAKFGKSFQEGPTAASGGVTDMMAKAQMNPMLAAVLKEATDIDLIGAGNLGIRQREFERGAEEWKTVSVPDGQGGSYLMKVPKYGKGGGEGQLMGYDPPKLQTTEVSTPEGVFAQPTNTVTGQPVGQPIKKGKAKGESAESSAKIALAMNGAQHVKTIKSMFVNKDGSVNRQLVFTANSPGGGIGQGRLAYATFIDALDARARAATGAAMPESEIKTYKGIYWPSPLDDDKTIKDKLNRLGKFMDDYLEVLDPNSSIRGRVSKKSTINEKDLPPDVDMIFNPQTGKLEPAK